MPTTEKVTSIRKGNSRFKVFAEGFVGGVPEDRVTLKVDIERTELRLVGCDHAIRLVASYQRPSRAQLRTSSNQLASSDNVRHVGRYAARWFLKTLTLASQPIRRPTIISVLVHSGNENQSPCGHVLLEQDGNEYITKQALLTAQS